MFPWCMPCCANLLTHLFYPYIGLYCVNHELAASFHWTANMSELLFTLAIALLTLVGDLNGSGLFAFKAVGCATAAAAAILQDGFFSDPACRWRQKGNIHGATSAASGAMAHAEMKVCRSTA